MSEETTAAVEATVREIRRRTRKKYSAEEKVRIVLEGLRGEEKIQVEQGIPRSRQTTLGGRYKTGSRQPRSGRDAQGERATQAAGG